jgi:hypothetical protein
MKVTFTLNEDDLRRLIVLEFEQKTGEHIVAELIQIEVKSKQNYKSEWENAAIRAIYNGEI